MLLNNREFNLKNYRNVYVKSSAKREYRDENVFLKGAMRMCERSEQIVLNMTQHITKHYFR